MNYDNVSANVLTDIVNVFSQHFQWVYFDPFKNNTFDYVSNDQVNSLTCSCYFSLSDVFNGIQSLEYNSSLGSDMLTLFLNQSCYGLSISIYKLQWNLDNSNLCKVINFLDNSNLYYNNI